MSPKPTSERMTALRGSLEALPFISPAQIERWLQLQAAIDASKDYLIQAVPAAGQSVEEAQKILAQRSHTLVFFGGTGAGKSTLINALLGRNLLPTGAVTAVTGAIVYIEQADDDQPESLTFDFWSRDEFARRVRRLCQLAGLAEFDITSPAERDAVRQAIGEEQAAGREESKAERDEYLDILLDCIQNFEANQDMYAEDPPATRTFSIGDPDALTHLREDGFKGSERRLIRLIRSATFHIRPQAGKPDMLMNGFLRIVDVPGLGAGMRLHEAITLEEMKREDALIVLVADGGRQRVDEMKSLAAVKWIKEHRLAGLSGRELDEAASKVFVVINGANVRQAFDRLNSGLPEANREVKEMTRYLAPNYWGRYQDRGRLRPYFLVMAPAALYVADPQGAPAEFAGETERILKLFADQLGSVPLDDPLHPQTAEALLELSEVPLLRLQIIEHIRHERVESQLREVGSRLAKGVAALQAYYDKELAGRGITPPYNLSWEALQERRYESALRSRQQALPRTLHTALLDLSRRTNSNAQFAELTRPSLERIQRLAEKEVADEVGRLLAGYGAEHWDGRDVTFDSLVWGASGIEVPTRRILYQVELALQEALASFMPQVAEVILDELEATLEAHGVWVQLDRAAYGQSYTYCLPEVTGRSLDLETAYQTLLRRLGDNYRQLCRQSVLLEMVRPERSIHWRLDAGAAWQRLPTRELALEGALNGGPAGAGPLSPAGSLPEAEDEQELIITILDRPADQPEDEAALDFEPQSERPERLEQVSRQTNRLFKEIIAELLGDEELLPRLRRLFWLEVTRAERDFNAFLVQPTLKQHNRNLSDPGLRQAMEMDLESLSHVEELMRVRSGLAALDASLAGRAATES
ncbi:MAG: dynamin family protein [Candidatus Promineifilaceae bacterium]